MADGTHSGRVALVTGSSRGVGRLICGHLLQEGATVLGFARGESTITHERYRHFQVDIGIPDEIAKTFAALRRDYPTLHLLINNAAIGNSQFALIMAAGSARTMVETNLLAPFLISREAAKLMRKGRWGRIINISSIAASLEPMGESLYSGCKAGLTVMGNVIAKEFADANITVNTLALSAVATDLLGGLSPEKVQGYLDELILSRLAQPDDIFNVIDFFASERSAFITAQTLFLGGVH